jgi:nitrate reductase alpha subunit
VRRCRSSGRRWTCTSCSANRGSGPGGELEITLRYLTPHSKWSIHSEYQDNLIMLTLSRGGPTMWMSEVDAAKIGVRDNDWIEAVNRNGVVVCRAVVTHKSNHNSKIALGAWPHRRERHNVRHPPALEGTRDDVQA